LEATGIESAIANSADDLAAADGAAVDLAEALAEAERTLERLTSDFADWNARYASLTRSREVASALAETSSAQLAEAQARLDAAMENAAGAPDVRAGEAAVQEARETAAFAADTLVAARAALDAAQAAEDALRDPMETAERETQRLLGEAKALADLLNPEGQGLWPPLVDAVIVQPGYENALAAALGDDLQAPLDEAAPHHWRDLGEFEAAALPDGVKPLSTFVKAPSALARRLAMTGVVFPDQGKTFQAHLKPGQRLVSPRGDLWRWDGYAASADAPSQSAVRLAQRNRLAALEKDIEAAKQARVEAHARYAEAKTQVEAARDAARIAEQGQRGAEQTLVAAQDETTRAARAAAERASQLATLEAEIRRLTQSRDAAREAERQAAEALEALGDGASLGESVARVRTQTAEARTASSEARATLESFKREGEIRAKRLETIGEDRARWLTRREAASQQIAELERRGQETAGELRTLEAVPEAIAVKRGALLDAIGTAEAARNTAADARSEAEARLADADKHARAADGALSQAREERARAQALSESATDRISEIRTRIRDELDATPAELPERAEIKEGQELPPLDQADKRVEKLKAEREALGGVNLRAEEEANEQETRLATLISDRADLEGAIERLRRGIQSLNREGRERLLASFEQVNRNFQMLFTKLFEGGEARLTFTESEDPLEAGLEIFARPPGKKLQSLGLLSGGEQALTAMALIFAVFLVNPAPICVLDEVDAPLDDANVERFCNLLDEMTRMADTRFLVVTHHALTMSRMHRLMGVTMAERGVSQLVSVSLAEAERVIAAE
jgi:chromosome segregation protein